MESTVLGAIIVFVIREGLNGWMPVFLKEERIFTFVNAWSGSPGLFEW